MRHPTSGTSLIQPLFEFTLCRDRGRAKYREVGKDVDETDSCGNIDGVIQCRGFLEDSGHVDSERSAIDAEDRFTQYRDSSFELGLTGLCVVRLR
jgi:hypothetical protein